MITCEKEKIFFSSALSISLLGGGVVPSAIFASSDVTDSVNTSSTATKNAGKSTISDHVITPQKSRDVFDDIFDKKDPVSRFVLDPGYGHLKIFAKNRGDSTITFSLVHTDSRKQYIVKTIGAHKKLLWDSVSSFSQGLRSGNYEIQWRAGGDIVHVTAWGVSGTDSAKVTTQRGIDAINVGITGGATAATSFDIPKGHGHVKLRMKNYSDHTVKVSLTHDNSNKVYITSLAIAPHDTCIWRSTDEGYSSGMRSGDYTLQWRGGDYKVDGHVWGVVGTQPADVQ
ncbi:hypothetical protein [Paenibacillus terrae]|uniref:Uncharacterized protein n=1 Tax=Paenibacillus terrae TaxID=159743 RepID=A0A0D7WU05_9BACL|nr:hypothetical protein [Paenibacillus terrae]KJD42661.1 hypothetical protein QD47_27005 [Paenibacillus terrae]